MEKVIFERCRIGNTVEKFEVTVGTKIFVGRCGSGLSVFGDNGTVTKISNSYVYVTFDNGRTVKINHNYRFRFYCAGKYSDYFFSVGERDFFDREKNPKCHNFRSTPLAM